MARKVMKQEVGTIYQKPSGTYYYRSHLSFYVRFCQVVLWYF